MSSSKMTQPLRQSIILHTKKEATDTISATEK